MNKKQIEALAYTMLEGSGSCDYGDVIDMLKEDRDILKRYPHVLLTDDDIEKIAIRAGELHLELSRKTQRKMNSAFPDLNWTILADRM